MRRASRILAMDVLYTANSNIPRYAPRRRQYVDSIPAPPAPLTEQPPCLVEIERYNPTAPKELPADEHITRASKTDPNGVVTCTLTEPGWWCITAQRNGGVLMREGKEFPVRERATLWVYVDAK